MRVGSVYTHLSTADVKPAEDHGRPRRLCVRHRPPSIQSSETCVPQVGSRTQRQVDTSRFVQLDLKLVASAGRATELLVAPSSSASCSQQGSRTANTSGILSGREERHALTLP